MSGFDPAELVRAIEEIIPIQARPKVGAPRPPTTASVVSGAVFAFAQNWYAVRGDFTRALRLQGLRVETTEADMPLAISAKSATGHIIIVDRGILGALTTVSQFMGLYWGYRSNVGTSLQRQKEKPKDWAISKFFNAYFLGLRWAGNFVTRFDVAPEGAGVDAAVLLGFWSTTFLLLHEASHIAEGENRSHGGAAALDEFVADEQALHMIAALAQARPFGEDPAFALLGAKVALTALGCAEQAYFLQRPTTHPTAPDRLLQVDAVCIKGRLFPLGSVEWSNDLVRPLDALSSKLDVTSVDLRSQTCVGLLQHERFFLKGREPGSMDQLEKYEHFSARMNLPRVVQMELLGRYLHADRLDAAKVHSFVEEGEEWCERNVGPVIANLHTSAGGGVGFRGAIELGKSVFEKLPYPVRTSAMCWFLLKAGWSRQEAHSG